MTTDFDYPRKDLIGAVVFRPDFNKFETINVNQALSLLVKTTKDWDNKLNSVDFSLAF